VALAQPALVLTDHTALAAQLARAQLHIAYLETVIEILDEQAGLKQTALKKKPVG
jgi:hypothetical protein